MHPNRECPLEEEAIIVSSIGEICVLVLEAPPRELALEEGHKHVMRTLKGASAITCYLHRLHIIKPSTNAKPLRKAILSKGVHAVWIIPQFAYQPGFT